MGFKATRIEFLNSTDKPLTVRPIKSSAGRFERFTLAPGETEVLRDSNPGIGNYDIEWDVLINPKGKRNDELVGEFRADNPWYSDPYIESADKKLTLAIKSNINFSVYGRAETEYFPGIHSANFKVANYLGVYLDNRVFTPISNLTGDVQGKYTNEFLGAFHGDMPYVKAVRKDANDGAYPWLFEVNYL